MQLTMSSGWRSLRLITSRTSSSVPSRMASASFFSTVVAPLSARSFIAARLGGGFAQALDLRRRQPPTRPRLEPLEPERAECDALERHDPVPHRLDHPPDLTVAALADRDLEARRGEPTDASGRCGAIVELDAFAQL